MKNLKSGAIFFAALILSVGLLTAQNPETIICQGTLTDAKGDIVPNEKCLVCFSITNTNEEVLFKKESDLTTNENGEFLYLAETLPAIFSDNWNKELVNFEISLRANEGANWLKEDEFIIKYHFEKNKLDDFTMTRYEGQVLNASMMNPIWQFSDPYPLGCLSSRFMVSMSKDFADPESIMTICKMMEKETEKLAPQQAAPAPSKRGIKGGYAVGGYKK